MSSALTLIVLGQAYFGALPNLSTGIPNEVPPVASIDQKLPLNVTRRPDYTYTPGIGSHKIHTAVTTWRRASRICQDEGGHLAVINSRAEADAIARIFEEGGPHPKSYSPGNAWIGTHDLVSQEGDWQTIFGDSLAQAGFEEWHEAKSTGGAHCGAVFRDGELSWFACTRDLGFICELPNSQSHTPITDTVNAVTQDATSWIRESLKKSLAPQ